MSHLHPYIKGVLESLERVVTAVLAPLTALLAALAHCQAGEDLELNYAWGAWHTLVWRCRLTSG